MSRFLLPLALIALLASLAGCGKKKAARPQAPVTLYVLVTSKLAVNVREIEQAEITPTPRYDQMRKGIKKLAVVAPTSCVSETASQASGSGAHGSSRVLETECGVEMTEIERVLAVQGYSVVSWRTMAQHRQRLPADVAAELGAQVLVQINSLERQDDAHGVVEAKLVHEYFNSDPSGARGRAVSLQPNDIVQLDRLIAPHEGELRDRPIPGAMLDLVVVDVATKENIWFYRWGRIAHDDDSYGASLLVRGDPQVSSYVSEGGEYAPQVSGYAWYAVPPQGGSAPPPQPRAITRTEQDVSRTTGAQDATRRAQWTILREIVADFAKRFHEGKTS